jgi:hypothetical protein
MTVHELKTWPEPYQAQVDGLKHHEVRVNDRGFAVGDRLLQREWDPTTGYYTGRELGRTITYITAGGTFGLPDHLCVLSLEPLS